MPSFVGHTISHDIEGMWTVAPGEVAPGRGALRLKTLFVTRCSTDRLVPGSGAGLQTRGHLKVKIGFLMPDTCMCDSSPALPPSESLRTGIGVP